MAIIDLGGRAKSEQTKEEIIRMLKVEFSNLSEVEKQAVMLCLKELDDPAFNDLATQGVAVPPRIYDVLTEAEYIRKPVDIETFVRDPYYLGKTCDALYPKLLEDMNELFAGKYSETVLSGSIGWGKTFFASIAACRIIYELSCMRDPHKSFGISKGSDITMVVLSVNEDLAIKVAFENIANKIKESEYFKENFIFKPMKKELIFPNKIQIAARASTDSAALGLNVFAAWIDESNFLQPMKKKGAIGGRAGDMDRAQFLYDQLIRRMKSRFQRHGKLPGMMIVVSSKQTVDDFTAKRVLEAKDDPTVFVRDYATWDTKPHGTYSSETFQVLVGNDLTPSKILLPEEVEVTRGKLQDGMLIIDVPIDFKHDFVTNIEDSIRDIAGVATVSVSPFIQQRDLIIPCIDPNRQHPFDTEEWVPGVRGKFIWSRLARQIEVRDGAAVTREWQPLFHHGAARHIHIDPSLNSDATGFVMGCITGYKTVVRRDEETREQYTERAPEIWVDLTMRIKPPVGGEIDHGLVRSLVYQLQAKGFSVSLITMDQFNSASSLQTFASKGITAERLSVDKPMDAYEILKTAIYENRISFYGYNPLLEELRWIQKDNMRNKVDHPQGKCFVGDTRIPLLDGTNPTIRELAGKSVWVYSCTQEGLIVPGFARGRMSGEVSDLVDVVLDSGFVERCTPNHRWMLIDGSYKEASMLQPGIDRLMPISRQRPAGDRRVRSIIPVKLIGTVPVFDLEVEEFSNFALSSGVIVHNSKDVADALAGIVFSLTTMYHGPPLGVYKGISRYSDPVADEQREVVEEDFPLLPFLQG